MFRKQYNIIQPHKPGMLNFDLYLIECVEHHGNSRNTIYFAICFYRARLRFPKLILDDIYIIHKLENQGIQS